MRSTDPHGLEVLPAWVAHYKERTHTALGGITPMHSYSTTCMESQVEEWLEANEVNRMLGPKGRISGSRADRCHADELRRRP